VIDILFVDDDQRVLDGLARMLRPERHRWRMTFVCGGAEAIEVLTTQTFDVLVCDMRMPEVDGLTVMQFAREHAPRTARIVLSGQTEIKAMTSAVTTMHQFVSKPCEPAVLRSVIERVDCLRSLLAAPALRDAVGRHVPLDNLPRTYNEFTAALDDPDASISSIVQIVERDVALAARCLQLANSAYFGIRTRVESIRQAVSYLGLLMLRDLVLSCSVFSALRSTSRLTPEMLERLGNHAACVASVARELHDDPTLRQQAFIAGMLHDIGWIVAAECGIEDGEGVAAGADQDGPTSNPADDDDATGNGNVVTHAELGAYLLGLWGLPHTIVEATAFHHRPELVPSRQFDVLGAVFLANELVNHAYQRAIGGPLDEARLIAYLASVGMAGQWPELRERAAVILEHRT